jgi:hypothetical protein
MRIPTLISSLFLLGAFAACTDSQIADESLYLTGTEESAITLANGEKACLHKKVLVCHIPPGNPANAHTICVGKPAAEPHQANHGDALGACEAEPNPPPEEPPPPQDADAPPPLL